MQIEALSDIPIKEHTLRELAISNSLSRVYAVGQSGGFNIRVEWGTAVRVLVTARGGDRVFSNLTSLSMFLKELGVHSFEVDSSHYVPGRVRAPRPDRSEALKRTRTKPRQSPLPLP